MEEIKMVDLRGQYLKIKDEIDAAIQEVLDATAFINGPQVAKFEKELASYLGTNHVIGCANGTDALQLALMALNLEPGDEVITTPFSFISTIEVIRLLRLIPVLADIRADTYNIDASLIERCIGERTRAIIPVHLFGQNAEMNLIMEVAQKYNLYVIEDAAQSLGSDYLFPGGRSVKSGTIGKIGCTSFFPSKNLGGYGDGGALFTDDDKLAGRIRSIANHGMKVKYYYQDIGINSRLDTLQAAILSVKLRHLDQYSEARVKVAGYYDRAFAPYPQIITPVRAEYSTHIFHQYTILLYGYDRNGLMNYLRERGIPTMVYYPVPLHLQEAYKDLNYTSGDLPVSEELSRTVLSLPVHTELTEQQLVYITDNLITYIQNNQQHNG
jgi:dTDP-4-amino-4,6-dideoxygalactose transaminase